MKYQEDNHYIDRVLSGDISAYGQLVAKHKNLVFSIALKILNNREDAEEIAQDTFLKAFHALKTFERKSKFSTWLYRIVYNAAISKTRKKRLELIPMDNYIVQNYTDDEYISSADTIGPEEQRIMITEAMKSLSDDENLLITLFYKGDNSIEDISQITGLTTSNVKVRLHRIRKKLHDELEMMMNRAVN
ncbi:MAG: sigma-70 family RNA polymerase sigma factor [Bacteroidales bacterium]|nr:sigma-70 family RNA polymerase sigma factor [Bacteroidales bacterium]NCA74876.1 sigma-70 family RNA polymerase sigma factor [Alphaproteobacteria bacterium]HNW72615.1 sigma-70 family RNA polymerase sigma factor [Bacteroidales bacterium]HPS49257.1 sigma-70 family RNA polymerase sigma factor [Bacteroidales bacterium]